MNVLLVSTYDLGRQPFGLASPAAWLRRAGHTVTCADLALGPLDSREIERAGFIAFHLPMHTATRLAAPAIRRARRLNARARLCGYGLYAPLNESWLRGLGVDVVLGGEFEQALVDAVGGRPVASVSLAKQAFLPPDRTGLPPLGSYARLRVNGTSRIVGYTEATRGCRHLCRHCPIVPVYGGAFRVVQKEVVLEDIRRQVEAGAAHITFGDPDFFNGPAHATRLVEALHREFPELTYDVTIKIEHLRKHRTLLPVLKGTGCVFVTSAVESIEDAVLEKLEKGHSRKDFVEVAGAFRALGLALSPTFIPFTPWTTRTGYRDLLRLLRELDLVGSVSPVQLALRLLIPAGSRLLELPEVRRLVGPFDERALVYRWTHPDPALDELAAAVLHLVWKKHRANASRWEIFREIQNLVEDEPLPEDRHPAARATIPYLEEPWYC